MSIFGDIDIESAADDPWYIPDGTYEAFVTNAEIKKAKEADKGRGLAINYKFAPDQPKGNQSVGEWLYIPTKDEVESDDYEIKDRAEKATSRIKNRMKDLGVPADRINSMDLEDILKAHVAVTIKNKGEYRNISGVTLWNEEAGADPFAS